MGTDSSSSESRSKLKCRKGLWSPAEDRRLRAHVLNHGHACWSSVPIQAGLQRNGKSCRLRWINYLRPGLKHGMFTPQEEDTILTLHRSLGNKWSKIARHLVGRTDNEIKNYWHSYLKKKKKKRKDGVENMNMAAGDQNNNNNNNVSRIDREMIISTTSSCVTSNNNSNNYTTVDDYVSVSPTNVSLTSQLVQPGFESTSSSGPYAWPSVDYDQCYDQWAPFDDHHYSNIHNMMMWISNPRIMFTEWLSFDHNETTTSTQAVDLETTLMYHNSPTVASDGALSRMDSRFGNHATASPGINDIDQLVEVGRDNTGTNPMGLEWSGTVRE